MQQSASVHQAILCLMLAAAIGLGLGFTAPAQADPWWQALAEQRLARFAAVALILLGGIAAVFWWNTPALVTALQATTPLFEP